MISLKGQFLVAMPNMADERFSKSVILVVGHSNSGAMGIVVNYKIGDLRFTDILDELDLGVPGTEIRLPETISDRAVMRGGPVEKGRGFVLHSPDYASDDTYAVTDEISMTATLDILKAMVSSPSPRSSLLALGYCGWGPGQLESEISGNGWLTAPFQTQLLFETPVEDRYEAALTNLHITRANLSLAAGHG